MPLFDKAKEQARKKASELPIIGGFETRGNEVLANVARSVVRGQSVPLDDILDDLAGVNLAGESIVERVPKQNFSTWGNLNPMLLAEIQPCDDRGNLIPDFVPITAPLTEATIEAQFDWQSPFENAGAESKAPALMALIQSGQASVYLNALRGIIGDVGNLLGSVGLNDQAINSLGNLAEDAQNLSNQLVGRTGITKLNSRQVFSGMPPVTITGNLHFRAIQDSFIEVSDPVLAFWELALPQMLADDGVIAAIYDSVKGSKDYLRALFPSEAPQFVSLRYCNERFAPLVIENIGDTLTTPRDKFGNSNHKALNITLSSLTAIDRDDNALYFLK